MTKKYNTDNHTYFVNNVSFQAIDEIKKRDGFVKKLTDRKDIEYEITFPLGTEISVHSNDTHVHDGVPCSIYNVYIGDVILYYHGLPFKLLTHEIIINSLERQLNVK